MGPREGGGVSEQRTDARPGVLDRLRGLDRRELTGLLVLAGFIVAAIAFWYVRSLPARVDISAGPGPARPRAMAPRAGPSPGPEASGPVLVVHVAGLVRHPGVYRFGEGDRVVDAIQRAGGPRRGADLTTINLAALLTDAEQIVVARQGSPVGSTGTSGSTVPGASDPGSEGLVNLNTATLDQLETLPGVGEVLGQRIVDYREEHGPFRRVEDLQNVSGIGEKRFADLQSKITV
jgi:competence protein ComEA